MILSHSIHPALTLQKRRKLKTHFVSLGIIVLLLQSCVSTVRSVLQCKQCKEFIEQCYLHLQCYFFPPSPLSWYWLKEDIENKFQNQSQWKFWSSDSVQLTTKAVLFPPVINPSCAATEFCQGGIPEFHSGSRCDRLQIWAVCPHLFSN